MISHEHLAGGRNRARRLLLTVVALLAGVTLATPLAATDNQEPAAHVTVREERGVYFVSARFDVAQPPPVALDVLTDYEGIPRFMPDIKSSVVLERVTGGAVVEQEAVSRLMMFSKRVHLVLEIIEDANTLRFRDRCGRSFARYEGSWRVTEHNGRTTVHYELVAQPTFDVPEFLLKRLLRRNSTQMVEQLQREIIVRSTRRPFAPAAPPAL